MEQPLTLLYLAHLNSDHVWQRPQQLMSRFATRCRVLYVDPPQVVSRDEPLHFQERPAVGSARVIRPIFPEKLINAQERQREARRVQDRAESSPDEPHEGNPYRRLWLQVLPELLDEVGPNTMLWVSSPLADYLVAAARSRVRLVVYDCMDDLASFRDGTDDMRRRENNLLKLADLLFTGGYSMYAARKERHPRAYCFPSGVDVAHFRRAQDPATRVPAAVARIPQPRLGYFGVLDERIDWTMIDEVAERRPDWQWVLVGPRAKVKRSELPEAPNIHYLGKRAYSRLPAYLKGFDIATMPFALNEATRHISPTKTPEYLAGGKQVISTSVRDVVAFYDQIVHIADGTEAWVETVERVLAATDEERQARLEGANAILQTSSWDSIVERMWNLMEEQLTPIHRRAAAS